LRFTPSANFSGTSSFTFQVKDDGGTANSGVDLDQSANTITFTINSVNDHPNGTDGQVTTLEDATYTFGTTDFGFNDPLDTPANTLLAVEITTLATKGTLTWFNGTSDVPVFSGQFISAADIGAGFLKFVPGANFNGLPFGTFTFQVQDDGG